MGIHSWARPRAGGSYQGRLKLVHYESHPISSTPVSISFTPHLSLRTNTSFSGPSPPPVPLTTHQPAPFFFFLDCSCFFLSPIKCYCYFTAFFPEIFFFLKDYIRYQKPPLQFITVCCANECFSWKSVLHIKLLAELFQTGVSPSTQTAYTHSLVPYFKACPLLLVIMFLSPLPNVLSWNNSVQYYLWSKLVLRHNNNNKKQPIPSFGLAMHTSGNIIQTINANYKKYYMHIIIFNVKVTPNIFEI